MNPETGPDRARIDRAVDIVSVILLTLTAVLSAICVYQSGRWSGEQTLSYNESSNKRIEAGLASAKSNQLQIIDVGVYMRYLDAMYQHDPVREKFIFERMRPEARPAVVAWLKLDPQHNPKAPETPFVMPEYRLATTAEQNRLNTEAAELFNEATKANEYSDRFLFLTVTFATVSFLGGISTKFKFPFHLIVVAAGCVALVYGVIRMTSLPFR